MDSFVLLLFIIGAIAIGKSSQKKKNAASAQKKQAPAVTPAAAPRPAPAVRPTVKPSVKPAEVKKPEPAPRAEEPHVHTPHVVAPSFYSGHAHEEGSLLSQEAHCVGVEVRKAPQEAEKKEPAVQEPKLAFDAQSVVQGFLYGEMLGKPKALR